MKTATLDISGAVVFWRCGPSDRRKLENGLKAMGLEAALPSDRTPKALLHEALKGLYGDANTLVRPLKKRSAFTVVQETKGDSENDYETAMSVEVDEEGHLSIDGKAGRWVPSTEFNRIKEAYDAARSVVPVQSVTRMLVDAIELMSGIALRPNGAVYWLPADRLSKWEQLAAVAEDAAIEQGSTAVYVMRTGSDAKALRAVRDGIITEINRELRDILDEVAAGGLGVKGLESRAQRAKALRQTLQQYETILGETLTELRERLDETEHVASEASLAASALA